LRGRRERREVPIARRRTISRIVLFMDSNLGTSTLIKNAKAKSVKKIEEGGEER